jgi:hypothetical protein
MPAASITSAVLSGSVQSNPPLLVGCTVHHSASIRIHVIPAAFNWAMTVCCAPDDRLEKYFW